MSRRGWLLFVTLCVVWGVPYLLIRVAVRDLDPVVVAWGRCVIGVLVLLPIALQRKAFRGLLKHWQVLLAYTCAEIVAPWWLLGWAETKLNSSTAGLLIALVPLFTAILVTRLGHDTLDLRRIVGLIVGFGGVAALIGLDIDVHNLLAVAAAIGTAIGYAMGATIIGRYLRDIPALGVITCSLIVSAVIYSPFAVLRRPVSVPAPAGWSVIGLGLICTAGAFLLLFALISEVGAARSTVITYINPAVAIGLGVLLLGEPFTTGVAIGFPFVILGAILATGRSRTATAQSPGEPAAVVPTGPPQ